MIFKLIRKLGKIILPEKSKLAVLFYYLKHTQQLDGEMYSALKLCKNRRVAIDVGANVGVYSYFYSKYFETVVSFEPRIETSSLLIKAKLKNVIFHSLGLSDRQLRRNLFVPIAETGTVLHSRASLINKPRRGEVIAVSTKTLDSFQYSNVDLIKIDVEGHEAEVISGAINTINRCCPVILIELEERHLGYPVVTVIKKIESLGYNGFVLVDGRMCVAHSAAKETRNGVDRLFNNFIFIPKDNRELSEEGSA